MTRTIATTLVLSALAISGCNGGGAVPETGTEPGVLVIQGILAPDGSEIVRLNPPRVRPWTGALRPSPSSGAFAARIEFEDGTSAVGWFDGIVADGPAGPVLGFFEVVMPVDRSIRRVRITAAPDDRLLREIEGGEIARPESPPGKAGH